MKIFRFVFSVCLMSGFLCLLSVVKADMGSVSLQSPEITFSTGDQAEEKSTFGGSPEEESAQTTCSMTPNGANSSIVLDPPDVPPQRPNDIRPYTPNMAAIQPINLRSAPYGDSGNNRRRGITPLPTGNPDDNPIPDPDDPKPEPEPPTPTPPTPPSITPEPATILIFGAGIAGLWMSRRKLGK